MTKKHKKATDTVIMIRLKQPDARRGEASLTIQRGDLAHMMQFPHTGLSLRHDVAAAVQIALQSLQELEAQPPRIQPPATETTESDPPPTNDAETSDTDTDAPPPMSDGSDATDATPPESTSDSQLAMF